MKFFYPLILISAYFGFKPSFYPTVNAKSATNNAPIFNSTNYSYNVSENDSVGSVAGTVSATDADGDEITYAINSGNTNTALAINAATGKITIAKPLNHHTQETYILLVTASDPGGLSAQTSVFITVRPATDIAPFTTIKWSTARSQPYGTHEVHGEVVKGKLYIFGGYDVQKRPTYTPTKRAFVYDPATNTWTPIADLPYTPKGTNFGGVTHEGLTTDGTDIYFAGGYTSNADGTGQLFGTKQVWRYNVASNTYTALPMLPQELAAGQLRYLKGKLHYMGGANKSRLDVAVHYALDLDSISKGWKVLSPLINACNHPGSAVYEGKIYFIAGAHHQDEASVIQKTVQVYNPDTDTWILAADLPVPRDHISSAVTVMGNRILVLGGETSHNVRTNLISAYTPATNTWENLSSLPVTKSAGVAAVLNGNLHYTGGNFYITNYKGTPITNTNPRVDNFTLINTDSSQPIQSLKNGDTLNLSTLPTKNLNIRANTIPAVIGSVMFNLSGAQSKNVAESQTPYALFGDDNNGHYYTWTPAIGNYILKATPYSGSGATGTGDSTLTISFTVIDQAVQKITLTPVADAFIRNGNFAAVNYGNDTTLRVKSSPSMGYTVQSFLRFSLSGVSNISSATLRIYGHNVENTASVNVSVYGVNNNTWNENGITWNNAPAASTATLSSIAINNQLKYYYMDVTSYVQSMLGTDDLVSFLLKDPGTGDRLIAFNSKESSKNLPQLLITYTGQNRPSNNTPMSKDNNSHINLLSEQAYALIPKAMVYPNPAHKRINVEFANNYNGEYNFQLVDPVGRIYELRKSGFKVNERSVEIDISKAALKPGVYFLRIQYGEKQNQIVKLIVE